ncbi:MAG: hypothetical protein GXY07_12360 [Candidatus Hydrogenedentes bacterium]|nr:hypothetical protein [Candidatus Hydrogenedentota bacterium]
MKTCIKAFHFPLQRASSVVIRVFSRPGNHIEEHYPNNAKKTGIQMVNAKKNATSFFHGFRGWVPVFSRPGNPFDTSPFSTAKNRNDPLVLRGVHKPKGNNPLTASMIPVKPGIFIVGGHQLYPVLPGDPGQKI